MKHFYDLGQSFVDDFDAIESYLYMQDLSTIVCNKKGGKNKEVVQKRTQTSVKNWKV